VFVGEMGTSGGVFESMDAALDSLVESDKHGLLGVVPVQDAVDGIVDLRADTRFFWPSVKKGLAYVEIVWGLVKMRSSSVISVDYCAKRTN
jgi:hypothetical protein